MHSTYIYIYVYIYTHTHTYVLPAGRYAVRHAISKDLPVSPYVTF